MRGRVCQCAGSPTPLGKGGLGDVVFAGLEDGRPPMSTLRDRFLDLRIYRMICMCSVTVHCSDITATHLWVVAPAMSKRFESASLPAPKNMRRTEGRDEHRAEYA